MTLGVVGGGSTAVAGATAVHSFEIRPVVATGVSVDQCADRHPDACLVAESRDGAQRYRLGPVIVDGADVKSAGVRFQSGMGWTVLIGLNLAGQRAFNAAAAAQFGQIPPADGVALVVDGVVVAAPSFQSRSFDGPIGVSGDFTKAEARAAARAIRRSS